jgi:hypothetical protein
VTCDSEARCARGAGIGGGGHGASGRCGAVPPSGTLHEYLPSSGHDRTHMHACMHTHAHAQNTSKARTHRHKGPHTLAENARKRTHVHTHAQLTHAAVGDTLAVE